MIPRVDASQDRGEAELEDDPWDEQGDPGSDPRGRVTSVTGIDPSTLLARDWRALDIVSGPRSLGRHGRLDRGGAFPDRPVLDDRHRIRICRRSRRHRDRDYH